MARFHKSYKCECKLLDDSIHVYEFASRDVNAEFISYTNLNLEYLGSGVIYSVDGVIQSFNKHDEKDIHHFWKLKGKK